MTDLTAKQSQKKQVIDRVEATADTLTGRGGLALFVRYLERIGLEAPVGKWFGPLRRSAKGVGVWAVFVQVCCFFLDGTSRRLVHFDRLKRDAGYAAVLETAPDRLLSSHAVKRFFQSFRWGRIFLLRRLLQRLFLWRLNLARPAVVLLGLDTMVLDNDEALKRQGVEPTYKKVKGFQPLQVTWGRFIVDAVFRSGSKHSNHGDTAEQTLRHLVAEIRRHYRADVPMVVRLDSGFFDQKLFAALEELGVGYIGGGKMYADIQAYARQQDRSGWTPYRDGRHEWEFFEFGNRRQSWKGFRRAIFCRLVTGANGQRRLEFARPDTVIYTNLGRGAAIDAQLRQAGRADLLEAAGAVAEYHRRGGDELVHRALKDFAAEELPFHRFTANAAYYYLLLTAFFLAETFKEDVCGGVVPLTAYPTTLRRTLIDIAAKIVRHAGRIILKVSAAVLAALDFQTLWARSGSPPKLSLT
jgi:hypothetical protein